MSSSTELLRIADRLRRGAFVELESVNRIAFVERAQPSTTPRYTKESFAPRFQMIPRLREISGTGLLIKMSLDNSQKYVVDS